MRLQDQAPISRRAKLLAPKRRGSALGQVSNPGVLNGSCGQVLPLTLMASCARNALTYKTGEGDRTGLGALLFSSFENGGRHSPRALARSPLAADITSERFWSIRPNGKSTKNWNRTPVGNGQ